ncbi:MAG: metalloregulator ArsR/SmtB family transcription factor [Parvibaculum sp.]|uniref:ArsR/SmtB family transcription factor n=1 Tax=Parvibaculum sp. TaxID=2024848 RepID=UPI002ABA0B49|nr:metalloregulator ArsR/SmtB family transcription factor [Parvibaculum sp.]MDZ4380353.1 metalloregulator ArsR/SmtB family transcription factor [Parvibaculum sp.]
METFAALADPTRRQIVEMLATGELAAGDIARRFEMSAPAVSQHLKALKSAHLVRVRVDAQRRIYSLDPEGLDGMETWLAKIRRFWGPKLDALESALNADTGKDRK